jgi:hypothetical protein
MTIQPARLFQHAIGGAGADGRDVVVEHHEGQPAVTVAGMAVVEVEDRLFFPVGKPPVPGHLAVVLVGLSVALLPLVELARAQYRPTQQAFFGQLGPVRPVVDVIDDLVAGIGGNPASLQSPPSPFFLGWQS